MNLCYTPSAHNGVNTPCWMKKRFYRRFSPPAAIRRLIPSESAPNIARKIIAPALTRWGIFARFRVIVGVEDGADLGAKQKNTSRRKSVACAPQEIKAGDRNRTHLAGLGMENCEKHNRNSVRYLPLWNQPTLTRRTHPLTARAIAARPAAGISRQRL